MTLFNEIPGEGENVYVIRDNGEHHCNICDRKQELREGVCWQCAEAESIIYEGIDMYDKGPEGKGPAKTAMEKLSFLIQKGWVFKKLEG